MDKIYYQPNHLWKGKKAIRKLKEYSKEKPTSTFTSSRTYHRPHYKVTITNEMHQFNLLYMPLDTLYGNKYKYILAGIDAASRYKVTRPLRTKWASDVVEMIADIYKVEPLTYPKIFQCNNGSEFKAEVTKLLEKHEVKIQRVTTKYKHTHTAIIQDPHREIIQGTRCTRVEIIKSGFWDKQPFFTTHHKSHHLPFNYLYNVTLFIERCTGIVSMLEK